MGKRKRKRRVRAARAAEAAGLLMDACPTEATPVEPDLEATTHAPADPQSAVAVIDGSDHATARAADLPGTLGVPTPREEGQASSVWLPNYLDPSIKAWLRENPHSSLRTLMLHGLAALGFLVRPEDLVGQRKQRWRV